MRNPVRDQIDLGRARTAALLAAEWARNIGRKDHLSETLSSLSTAVHASTALVVRKECASGRKALVAAYNTSSGKLLPSPSQSLSDELLAGSLGLLQVGKTNLLSDLLGLNRFGMEDSTGFSEIAVCVLESHDDHVDFLELQFESNLAEADLLLLQIDSAVFAAAWRNRMAASVKSMLTQKRIEIVPKSGKDISTNDILSTDNPKELTRAEFRICTLIREGYLPENIRTHLEISATTYRSHMRSIYLKTEMAGQLELVHALYARNSA